MPRGGPRPSTPGGLYPNRSDMATQPAQAPKNQEYGKAGAQLEAQQSQPIAGSPSASLQSAPLGGLEAGQVPTLSDPSARPDEPLTAGLPVGAGPGPEALQTVAFGPEDLSILRGVYAKYPSEDLRRVIEWTQKNLG